MIRSISRAVDLLHCFAPDHPEWGVTELATRLRMRKSGVHRILITFLEHDFVRQIENRKYALGPRLVHLAHVYRSRIELFDFARPTLEELAENTGKTCHIAKLHEDEIVYLYSAYPKRAVHFTTHPVTSAPAYRTALGKVLLAHLPAREQRRVIGKIRFERRTAYTITSASHFDSHLQRIREQGYAIDNQENILSLCCIAAPIRNANGEVEAAMSLAGHVRDISEENLCLFVNKVREAAGRISAKMGYRESGSDMTPILTGTLQK